MEDSEQPNTIPSDAIRPGGEQIPHRILIEGGEEAWTGMDETAVEPVGQEACRRAIGSAVVDQSPALATTGSAPPAFGPHHTALDREAAPLQVGL